jgi:UDP-N-acetylmuramate: L-alanyl-gamma-D-glutamyl-meso-diaminopimelate ligase
MHIHILGICGTFMGGIAAIAKEAGHQVSGCDANVYPPMSDQLRALGIELIDGFSGEQLSLKPDLWVIGNVVSRGNPLMEAILDAGLPYISGPQWLAEQVLKDKWVLAVAGTHGKTTTASMLTWLLEANGYNPGFLIGGVPGNFGLSARLGGEYFVIEADEYDTAFFDKRSKFVHYRPRTVVLNNLEFDHADIFADLAAIETQFHHLVRTVPGKGRVIVNAEAAALERVLSKGIWSEKEAFGAGLGRSYDWSLEDLSESADASEFRVHFQQAGDQQVPCSLALAGKHNRLNAVAAMAAARHVGLTPPLAAQALRSFKGVKRRLEVRGVADGVTVIDDFAHHPTAIETTIAGLRARLPKSQRILAVLEPRSNTMKMGAVKASLAPSLAGADKVFCYQGGLGWDTAQALAPLGDKSQSFDQLPEMVAAILEQARSGDSVLVMSNGGFGGVHQKLLDQLKARAA